VRGRDPAQFLHGGGRHSTTSDVLGDPVPNHGRAVIEIAQIERAELRAVCTDQQRKMQVPASCSASNSSYDSSKWSKNSSPRIAGSHDLRPIGPPIIAEDSATALANAS
jgi:hypothetical protein